MYQNNNYRPRFRGGNRGMRHQKTFDPSSIVENLKRRTPEDFVDNYVPKHKFADFELCSELKNNIIGRGYTLPTPIQDEAIPEIINGRDVVGIANTGTGKTGAFLLPLINKIYKDKNQKVLIVAPTRELAVQIEKELYSFTRNMGIFSTIAIGGLPINKQIYHLRKGPHFVIGTPGRLLDLYEQRAINFADYQTVVLDEVDRMLDMGFLPDMERIISKLPQPRQSLFFSATMTDNVRAVMNRVTPNPVSITVMQQDVTLNVTQDIMRVSGDKKVSVLCDLLYDEAFEKVLVFGRTKRGVENLSRRLSQEGFSATSIHGNKSQNQRQRALNEFRVGHIKVLLATDVASRGIDVDDITHVINYDLPETYEDYVHRIGRTGRANKKGVALTFVD